MNYKMNNKNKMLANIKYYNFNITGLLSDVSPKVFKN